MQCVGQSLGDTELFQNNESNVTVQNLASNHGSQVKLEDSFAEHNQLNPNLIMINKSNIFGQSPEQSPIKVMNANETEYDK